MVVKLLYVNYCLFGVTVLIVLYGLFGLFAGFSFVAYGGLFGISLFTCLVVVCLTGCICYGELFVV